MNHLMVFERVSSTWNSCASLEPSVGFLHEFSDYQTKQSLVYDLMEPYRWIADLSVIRAFESGVLDLPDFYFTGDDYRYRFEVEAKRRFIAQMQEQFNSGVEYRGRTLHWDTVIEQKIAELGRFLVGRSHEVDFTNPELKLERVDNRALRQKILSLTQAGARSRGISKSTLHYLRRRARSPRPFKTYSGVRERWWPEKVRCLVIGENPGALGSAYFYDPIPVNQKDPVYVRRHLLQALSQSGLIQSSTLNDFRDGGFVFDHAIRRQLPAQQIKLERKLAERFESKLAAEATHLPPLVEEAASVWAMGWIARNAMVSLYPSIPRERRKLTPPYRIDEISKIFVSRYFTRWTTPAETLEVVRQVRRFIPTDG